MKSPSIILLILAILALIMSFVSFKHKMSEVKARKNVLILWIATIWALYIVVWAIIAFIVNHIVN
jgi:hypothetical protein